jgi:AraC-like DNA-binding protein
MSLSILERPATTKAVPPRGANPDYSVQIVASLLRAGLESMGTDCSTAKDLFSKAYTVLESGSSDATFLEFTKSGPVRGGLVPWQIKRVKAHIDANLDKPVSIRELAATVRLGPSHFQRAFKVSLGVSPHTFIVQRRIERAKELMLSSDSALSEIALAAGFSDQSHLTTRFHRAVGVTPALWRRENRGAYEVEMNRAA